MLSVIENEEAPYPSQLHFGVKTISSTAQYLQDWKFKVLQEHIAKWFKQVWILREDTNGNITEIGEWLENSCWMKIERAKERGGTFQEQMWEGPDAGEKQVSSRTGIFTYSVFKMKEDIIVNIYSGRIIVQALC